MIRLHLPNRAIWVLRLAGQPGSDSGWVLVLPEPDLLTALTIGDNHCGLNLMVKVKPP